MAPLTAHRMMIGMSKDFTMNGYRSGFLYSQSSQVLKAYNGIAHFSMMSNDTQYAVTQLLSDQAWLEDFLERNKHEVYASYTAMTQILEDASIPYLPCYCALFLLLDLRQWLESDSFEAESKLHNRIFEEARVVLVPGKDMCADCPGLFRLCFTATPRDWLITGLTRICDYLKLHASKRK